MAEVDRSHDRALQSWVTSANGHADFPIQNLPFGLFTTAEDARPRACVAIGDMVLDLRRVVEAGLLDEGLAAGFGPEAPASQRLNAFLGQPPAERGRVRLFLCDALALGSTLRDSLTPLLVPAASAILQVPAAIGDFTDFYVGINHARNVGMLLRPDNPLLPNYKHIPIAYHGRASSIVPSGTPITRPNGQRKRPDEPAPSFGPCRNLDYELELAAWVGAENALGEPVPVGQAQGRIAGYSLLNDWSARDIQSWEYVPLGPFLAKSFASTVSPWIVTPEALAPFRTAQPERPPGDPRPLAYLWDEVDQSLGAFDIDLDVWLTTAAMREAGMAPFRLARSNTRHMYWTFGQMVAHHTSNGCNLRTGDLLGSGTISAPDALGFGSFMEKTGNGKTAVHLPSGETRTVLADGDEITFRASAHRDGYATIGFGDCRGRIVQAR